MKIKFLMDGGYTIVLNVYGLEDVRGAIKNHDWLWDRDGLGVNLAKVAGFTPVDESAEPEEIVIRG